MTPRNALNTFDVIIYTLSHIVSDSGKYVEEDIENHNRKFPRDRGSVFIRNLTQRVVSDQDIYISKLIGNVQLMQREFRQKTLSVPLFNKNVEIATDALKHILSKILIGSDRDRLLQKAIVEYANLKRFVDEYMQQTAPNKIPVSYTESGWKEIAKDMWQKEQGNFVLLVQKFGKEFFSTVKDVKHMRIYSNNIPFNTLTEAMNTSVTSMAKLVHSQPQTEKHEYKPKYIGGQGRLF